MMSQPPSYRGYRFPPEIISHAVSLYHRFGLSFRDVEDLLAERGVSVTYESIRQWCLNRGRSLPVQRQVDNAVGSPVRKRAGTALRRCDVVIQRTAT